MSTPDTQHMIRVVAEKFLGWKPHDCPHDKSADPCDGSPSLSGHPEHGNLCGSPNFHERHHVRRFPCECRKVPPPDLLQPDGAWALVGALRKADWQVSFGSSGGDIHLYRWNEDNTLSKSELEEVDDDTLPLALLTAAFALTEEGRK